MNEALNIKEEIAKLKTSISNADNDFEKFMITGDVWYHPSWSIETCFLKLLAIVEGMGLMEFHKMILSEYASIKGSKGGFIENESVAGEPFSVCLS